MGEANTLVLVVLFSFVAMMILIGLYYSKRTKSTKDFWIGGGNVGLWVTAISYVGTYTSTVALIGGPSSTYLYGLGYGIWQVAGTAWLFGLLPFLVMAVPMKRMATRLNAVTVPGWLASRFDSEKVRVISAILIAIFMIPYGTSVIQAAGVLLSTIANIPYIIGILITAVTVTIYMSFSGYMGISVNALIQGWIILIGALLIAPIALGKIGGISGMLQNINDINPQLLKIPGTLSIGNFISMSLVWGLICWGQPQLVTRFYAVKDSKTLGVTMVVVTIFTVLTTGGYHLNGLIARAMYGNQFVSSPDMAVPTIAADMLPPVLGAVFVAAAVGAAMSTLASTGLVVSSAIAKDLFEDSYMKSKGKVLSNKKAMSLSRLCIVITTVLSFAFAVKPVSIVFSIAVFAQGTIAAALTGSILFGVYWKRANWQGCVGSMITGTLVTLIWYFLKIPGVHAYFPGIICSILVFPIISLITPAPSKELVQRAFGKIDKKNCTFKKRCS